MLSLRQEHFVNPQQSASQRVTNGNALLWQHVANGNALLW